MRDVSNCRRQVWIKIPLALTLILAWTGQVSAQVAPKESSSKLIHHFPPLPDIVQRKAEIDAKRNRTGILTKIFVPKAAPSDSIIEIDLDLSFKKSKNKDLSTTNPPEASPPSSKETVSTSASSKEGEIITTSHQEPADDSDNDPMPLLPEVVAAVEPTLPTSNAPKLRSADATEEKSDAPTEEPALLGDAELPPPTAAGSMKAPSMRRDRRQQEVSRPSKPAVQTEAASLPRTLPEMDAPPIREAITQEQADAAQRDLEKKLLSVTKRPELMLPEMPTEQASDVPVKVVDVSDSNPPASDPIDELADVRNELHRLAKPIPVQDPSLELAAEELKQLAESEELQDAAATVTTHPAKRPLTKGTGFEPTKVQVSDTEQAAKPGLKFARDAVSSNGIQTPAPIQPVANEVPLESKTTLDAPPAINLPPVNLDRPTPPEKKESATRTTSTESQQTTTPPAVPKREKTPPSEPTLKPIPPAASLAPAELPKKTILDAPPASAHLEKAPIAEQKPRSNIPKLRRESESSALSSKTPLAIPETPMHTAIKPTATENSATAEHTLTKMPVSTSKKATPTANIPPASWRPAMPPHKGSVARSDETTIELIRTGAELTEPSESKTSPPAETQELPLAGPTKNDPAKPRILAPIEADELGTTSTRTILMPAGDKLARVDFSRSLAARAIDTLVTSKARTARERALADLHRMDLWFKADGTLDAVKQVALADDRLLMRQAAVEVLAATPTNEKQVDRILADIAATNSENAIRHQAREAISQRNRRG